MASAKATSTKSNAKNEKLCMLCKKFTEAVSQYSCSGYTCDACIDTFIQKDIKKFQCKRCESKHNIKHTSDLIEGASTRIQKKHKTRARWTFMGREPAPKRHPRSKIRNSNYTKQAFNYERCVKKVGNKHVLKLSAQHKLESIDEEFKKQNGKCMCPIFEDKLLIGSKDMLYVIDTNGKVHQKYESSFPGNITFVGCNSKYIYAVHHLRTNEGHLAQYDLEFNLLNDSSFEYPCQSFACTEKAVFYTTPFGNEWNLHTMIYVLNANTLEIDDSIGYEYESDEKYYCPKFNEDAPRTVAYGDRVYFVHKNHEEAKEGTNRIDIVDPSNCHYLGHIDMPAWFMGFRFDAKGQFVNYSFEKNAIALYANNGKQLGEFHFEEKIKKNTALSFCCTNNGHLVLLKNKNDLEVY